MVHSIAWTTNYATMEVKSQANNAGCDHFALTSQSNAQYAQVNIALERTYDDFSAILSS